MYIYTIHIKNISTLSILQDDLSNTQPYIKPFGPRFDKSELPYFKYRETVRLTQLEATKQQLSKQVKMSDVDRNFVQYLNIYL